MREVKRAEPLEGVLGGAQHPLILFINNKICAYILLKGKVLKKGFRKIKIRRILIVLIYGAGKLIND